MLQVMARQARLDAPGALHHVMGRGIEGIKIFRNKTDREDFLGRLEDLCKGEVLMVYTWALLDNHIYVELNISNDLVSKHLDTQFQRLIHFKRESFDNIIKCHCSI